MTTEEPRMIKMGPASPELNLPPASIPYSDDMSDEDIRSVSHHGHKPDNDDNGTLEDVETLSDDFSVDTTAFQKTAYLQRDHRDRGSASEPRQMQDCISELRHLLHSHEKKLSEEHSSSSDSDEEEDLDSNAFMWDASSMPMDYLDVLDKAIEKQSPTLFELMARLEMDDMNVEIALKEMIATEEETPSILKRMRGRKPQPCTAKNVKRLTAACSQHVLKDSFRNVVRPLMEKWSVKALMQNPNYAYTLDREGVHLYDTSSLPEFLGVDIEDEKVAVLKNLLGPVVKKYHTRYQKLLEIFREAVTSGDYSTPKEGVEAETPYEWVTRMVSKAERFNVQSFIHDSRIGELENKRQCFGSTTVVASHLSYFLTRDRRIVKEARNFTFDLGKTDDLLQRFAKHSGEATELDLTLILAKLGVYLSKPCVLLRFFINYHYPNVAIWLRLIEYYEHDLRQRILSPFFPPMTTELLQFQLTETGILDNTDKFISLAPLTPYVPPTPPPMSMPPSQSPLRVAPPYSSDVEESDEEDGYGEPDVPPPPLVSYLPPPAPRSPDFRFSSMFKYLSGSGSKE